MQASVQKFPDIRELPLNEFQKNYFSKCEIFYRRCFESEKNNPITTNDHDSNHRQVNLSEKAKEDSQEVAKGIWAKNEDNLLLKAISEFADYSSINWNKVASQVPLRTAKQCKERWTYRLQPFIKKNPFERWEDEIIVKERYTFGNHWTLIAKKLPGRTAVAVKNRWHSVLRHRYPH